MYLYTLYFPLIAFLISIMNGKKIGSKGACLITTTCIGISNILSFYILYEVALLRSPCHLYLASWINLDLLHVEWGFLFDTLTAVMLVVITSISLCAHMYSINYMSTDPHQPRFMAYLSLFTFFMIILVTSNNLLQLFVGWEGVGLCSYLLINFWFTRIQANKSAIKALITNKVSDVILSMGIFITFYVFKSINFATILTPVYFIYGKQILFLNYNFHVLSLVCLFMFIGAVGKSAQIGLHIWLPDAMEGPTPVSSLIHAATMVTAGVFLVVRLSFFFEFANNISLLIIFVGAVTAFFSSTTGLFQNDLKKVIAYSTCSQIGYMIFTCGYSGYAISMFHLSNHAFFKALLFLTAGSIIHALNNEQDFRKMGGLLKVIPFSYVALLVGSLALTGFPFLTGFYSKDLILEISYVIPKEFLFGYTKSLFITQMLYWLITSSIIFTAFYSIRVLSLTFYGYFHGFKSSLKETHDAPNYMLIPLVVLSIASIFVGYLTFDLFAGFGTDFWGNSFFLQNNLEYEFQSKLHKSIPLITGMYSTIIALFIYNNKNINFIFYLLKWNNYTYPIITFLNKKWFFDKLYNDYIINALISFSYKITFKLLDKGAIEILGPFGITRQIYSYTYSLANLQTGYIYHYVGIVINTILYLLLPIFIFYSDITKLPILFMYI